MKNRTGLRVAMAGVALIPALLSACGPVAEPLSFQYDTTDVDANALPQYDTNRLYRYTLSAVNTDSILRVLLAGRMPVDEAWLSTEDDCDASNMEDPRFTLIMEGPNSQIGTFGFEPGNGIPACAIRVRRFTITRLR